MNKSGQTDNPGQYRRNADAPADGADAVRETGRVCRLRRALSGGIGRVVLRLIYGGRRCFQGSRETRGITAGGERAAGRRWGGERNGVHNLRRGIAGTEIMPYHCGSLCVEENNETAFQGGFMPHSFSYIGYRLHAGRGVAGGGRVLCAPAQPVLAFCL